MASKYYKKIISVTVFLILLSFSSAIGSVSEGKKKEILNKIHLLRIPFIENKGQIKGEGVKYYAKTFGGTVFITEAGEIVYSLPDVGGNVLEDEIALPEPDKNEGTHNDRKGDLMRKGSQKGVTLKEEIIGGKIKEVKGEVEATTKVGYFRGRDRSKWKSNISTYNLVSLGEVYKGIELKLKAYGNNVEKLFNIKPEANPENINIKLNGAKSLKVNDNGMLEVVTELGEIKFTKPVAYQTINGNRIEVEVAYEIYPQLTTPKSGLMYGFKVGAYNKGYPLIIDPLLASTFIGGSNDDNAYALAIDSSGNIFVAGRTWSTDYPITAGAYDISFNGASSDVFVSKLNAGLTNLLSSTFIGGDSDDVAEALVIDSSGNIFVAGWTSSVNYPTTAGAYDTTFNGGSRDVFVSRLDNDLTDLLASTFIGGSFDDYAYALAIDSSGNVFITGAAYSSDYPTTSGAYDTSYNGGSRDIFISRLDNDLTDLLASTFIGGNDYDYAYALAIDSSGNVFITGYTYSSDYPTTPEAYDTTPNGSYDVFVSKLNAGLTNLLASTFIGGSYSDYGYALAIDSSGNVFIAGYTYSSDYPTTSEAYDTSFNGGSRDVFVSRLYNNLTGLIASTFIGGNDYDYAYALAIDSSGNVFITGYTHSSDYPTTSGAYDTSFDGSYGVFVSKLDPNLFDVFFILWQNQATGDIVFWQMDGMTIKNQFLIGNVPDTNWRIVDCADFNQDGKQDLLWQNQTTGDVCIWLMDGTAVIGVIPGGGVSDPYWRVTIAVDYSGDGKPDYLWQHQQRGDLYTWFLDWNIWWGSIVVTGGTPSGGVSDTDWKIIGTGDFNSDGNPDYLWQHQARGDIYIWYTDGYVPTGGSHYIGARYDINWKIVGIADFNKDGKPDILWRHQVNGQNEVWFMDGVTYSGSASMQTVLDLNWKIAGPK